VPGLAPTSETVNGHDFRGLRRCATSNGIRHRVQASVGARGQR
jgi:hypothetical protein